MPSMETLIKSASIATNFDESPLERSAPAYLGKLAKAMTTIAETQSITFEKRCAREVDVSHPQDESRFRAAKYTE